MPRGSRGSHFPQSPFVTLPTLLVRSGYACAPMSASPTQNGSPCGYHTSLGPSTWLPTDSLLHHLCAPSVQLGGDLLAGPLDQPAQECCLPSASRMPRPSPASLPHTLTLMHSHVHAHIGTLSHTHPITGPTVPYAHSLTHSLSMLCLHDAMQASLSTASCLCMYLPLSF